MATSDLKHKALFFTTSPRTPAKMIPEIQLLCEHFSGRKWNKHSQVEFLDLLVQTDFFEGSGSPKNKDFSARDRINRAPKALGFVDLSPHIELTNAGKALIYGNRPQEAFLRQLLKFQFPSPYHREADTVKGTFFIKPYLEIMRLIRDLESLSFDELKIFALMMTDYRQYDAVKTAILNFRAEKEAHIGQYKKFVDEKWTDALLQTYSDDIDAGKTKTRETTDKSLKKFLTTKKKNTRDYTDACFRYLRYTGLVSISHKNRSISFYPDKLKEVDFILASVDRKPVFVDDAERYKEYLFNAAIPALYVDNITNVIDHLMRISGYTQRQLAGKSIEELKDIRDAIVAERKEAVIKAQVTEIKSYALYSEIIDTYNEIISDGYYDAPLMLEYNTWRAMTMLDGGNIKGNFKFDDVGQPLSTASGNMPDIECDYEDFVLSVEVTMQHGQRQYESEGEPVARHFGQMKKRTGKEAYCIFIAPTINKACLAHFFALNKIGISYYGGKTKIIPLELDQFMRLVDNSYNYHTQPTPHDIRQFLDEVMRQEELAADENDWSDRIQNCVAQWLVA
ncbi:MAG: AlwI family type II restriction endonuclease [Clostridia bacterium]|nr:AlwI family type II restriction endonuclease [Clostridia bacterium]